MTETIGFRSPNKILDRTAHHGTEPEPSHKHTILIPYANTSEKKSKSKKKQREGIQAGSYSFIYDPPLYYP